MFMYMYIHVHVHVCTCTCIYIVHVPLKELLSWRWKGRESIFCQVALLETVTLKKISVKRAIRNKKLCMVMNSMIRTCIPVGSWSSRHCLPHNRSRKLQNSWRPYVARCAGKTALPGHNVDQYFSKTWEFLIILRPWMQDNLKGEEFNTICIIIICTCFLHLVNWRWSVQLKSPAKLFRCD